MHSIYRADFDKDSYKFIREASPAEAIEHAHLLSYYFDVAIESGGAEPYTVFLFQNQMMNTPTVGQVHATGVDEYLLPQD